MSDLALASPDRAAGAASRPAAAAVVWQWRRDDEGAGELARRAAAARRKGALGGIVGLAVASGLYFWKPQAAMVVAAVALATTLLALASPLGGFQRLSRALDTFGRGVGTVSTWLLMGLAYYLLFLPLGLLLRATGKLRISRGPDPRCASYWVEPAAPPPSLDGYRKPF